MNTMQWGVIGATNCYLFIFSAGCDGLDKRLTTIEGGLQEIDARMSLLDSEMRNRNEEFRTRLDILASSLRESDPGPVPEPLGFTWDQVKLTLYQRSASEFPGSRGTIRLQIGDITGQQVLLTVSGLGREPIIDSAPMRAGDVIFVPMARRDYVVRLHKLVNLLVGNDYAVFTIMPSSKWDAQMTERLLDAIEKSEATFIRNEREFTGTMFSKFLREKYNLFGPKTTSVDQFIEDVASSSLTTGQPYEVKLPSGEIIDAATWLRQQARELEVKGGQL